MQASSFTAARTRAAQARLARVCRHWHRLPLVEARRRQSLYEAHGEYMRHDSREFASDKFASGVLFVEYQLPDRASALIQFAL